MDGKWCFPSSLATPSLRSCSALWNLVLEDNHLVNMHGAECVTLGHGFEGPVVGHDFWGTSKVIEELNMMHGWDDGHVCLISGCVSRDKTGRVNGLMQTKA